MADTSGHAESDQGLIDRLSHKPPEVGDASGMIRIKDDETPKIPRLGRAPMSTIGQLDKLPLEVIHMILNGLDFRSISRFSRTSLRASAIVQSLHTYRDLMQYAPRALAALAMTGLITQHSANTLHIALQSQNCSSCRSWHGTYLFLPTCVRCCWNCLVDNKSFWMIPRGVAARCFRITLRQVDQLPVLRTIPGWYCVGYKSIHQKAPQQMVCIGSAKKLALTIHGSEAKIKSLGKEGGRHLSSLRQNHYRHYRAAQLQPYSTDPILLRGKREPINDPYGGIASIIFPSAAGGVAEYSFWCRGCHWISKNIGMLESSVQARLLPDNLEPVIPLLKLPLRARSRENFLLHIRHCYGIRQIAQEAGLEHWLREITATPIDQWT